ncbi:uncharacterized protein LOC130965917 [Arachis stenosperma]|uniref:uncharacterized protein LOC130965917 n=1 Tax=Arachis stenosperma TaxID=217475 RepID=UPI0025AC63D9|nr:uncharacterized protein LOC130965917 [Arachis stenosperma]
MSVNMVDYVINEHHINVDSEMIKGVQIEAYIDMITPVVDPFKYLIQAVPYILFYYDVGIRKTEVSSSQKNSHIPYTNSKLRLLLQFFLDINSNLGYKNIGATFV